MNLRISHGSALEIGFNFTKRRKIMHFKFLCMLRNSHHEIMAVKQVIFILLLAVYRTNRAGTTIFGAPGEDCFEDHPHFQPSVHLIVTHKWDLFRPSSHRLSIKGKRQSALSNVWQCVCVCFVWCILGHWFTEPLCNFTELHSGNAGPGKRAVYLCYLNRRR